MAAFQALAASFSTNIHVLLPWAECAALAGYDTTAKNLFAQIHRLDPTLVRCMDRYVTILVTMSDMATAMRYGPASHPRRPQILSVPHRPTSPGTPVRNPRARGPRRRSRAGLWSASSPTTSAGPSRGLAWPASLPPKAITSRPCRSWKRCAAPVQTPSASSRTRGC